MSHLQSIKIYSENKTYFRNIVSDPKHLPKEKQEFYIKLLETLTAADAIIGNLSDALKWHEQSTERSRTDSEVMLKKQLHNVLSLARAKGVDVELMRFL